MDPSKLLLHAHSQKRHNTAALHNVAVIFAPISPLASWSAAALRRFPMWRQSDTYDAPRLELMLVRSEFASK